MITGFAFTKIIVADIAAMERFYVEGLGLGVVTRISVDEGDWALEEVVLSVGPNPGTQLNLVQYRDRPCPAPGEAVVGLSVRDIGAVIEAVSVAGGAIVVPVQVLPDYALRLAYVSDPEGHLIELIEPMSE